MAKRIEPVRKNVKDVLNDLATGYREASIHGPEFALKYLLRTMEGQQNLPNAVKAVAFDLTTETKAQLRDWPGVEDALQGFLKYLPDMEEAMGHGFREALMATTALERGVQARSEIGDFHGAWELCGRAIELGLGSHWESKRDSLDGAR